MSALTELFRNAADTLQQAEERPHGRKATPEEGKLIGEACVALCGGEHDKARAFWKLIVKDLGYMPWPVGWALIRASDTSNVVPDIEAPDPGGADV